jgi:dipeptidyl aminopeptidase/acylaminoacyl peptidase
MSARLFLFAQHVAGRLYFVSNLSGHLSLYAMEYGGSVPEPLLPPHLALHNPDLVGGYSYCAFPRIGKILVMLDHDGDENYQPMLIPMDGGFPEPSFRDFFAKYRVHLIECDKKKNVVYLAADRRDIALIETYRGDLKTGELVKMAESPWGMYPLAHNRNHSRALLLEQYLTGDDVLFLAKGGATEVLYGTTLSERKEGEPVKLNGLSSGAFAPSGRAALVSSAVFADSFSLGYIRFARPGIISPVKISGIVHKGMGELVSVRHLVGDRYAITYNIDGCSWVYEGVFEEERLIVRCKHVLVGRKPLSNGKLEHLDYDEDSDIFTATFSSATTPTQIYTIEGKRRDKVVLHTREKIVGIRTSELAPGEDVSFVSHDGLRVSARLYMPAASLGYEGARPLVYYIHGGPQGQERPDFAWFSMPLIQYLTLRGFAVFVPNVRGSTGYGLSYTKHVDRDWGGKDRLDHVHAMTEVLPKDKRLDTKRTAVVGRSYGGYMTLMLAGCDPELWAAACDMFGPYDLLTFLERIPSTWKPYYRLALGDASKPEEKVFLSARSPKTHLHNMTAPMLVIQGRNDPRVVAAESEDLVRELRADGKQIELLVFENEGHDVLKFENRVRCYEAITSFFADHLKP